MDTTALSVVAMLCCVVWKERLEYFVSALDIYNFVLIHIPLKLLLFS